MEAYLHATLKQITSNFNERELHEISAHAHMIDIQHDGLFFDLSQKMQVLKLYFIHRHWNYKQISDVHASLLLLSLVYIL